MTQFTKPTRKNDGQRVAYVNARLIDPESGLDAKGKYLTFRYFSFKRSA